MHVYVLAIRKPAKYNKTTENNRKTFFRCHDCNLMMCKISNAALSELMELMGSGITTVYEPSSKKKKKMMLFYTWGEKREAGVNFILDDRTTRSVLAFQLISNSLAVLTVHGTDHYLIHAKLQLQLQWAMKKAPLPAKPNWACMSNPK